MRKIRKFKDLIEEYKFRLYQEHYNLEKNQVMQVLKKFEDWSKLDKEQKIKLNFFIEFSLRTNKEIEEIIKEAISLYDNNFFVKLYFLGVRGSLEKSKRRINEEKEILERFKEKCWT